MLRDWGVAMMKAPEPLAHGDDDPTGGPRPVTIGRALERRRVDLNLTRDAAAEAIGVSRSTYSAYESDLRRLSPDVLRTLAVFLGIDVEETLDLYGATCVAQARRALFGVSPVGSTAARAGIRRATRSDDMAIVERVYFDAAAREDVRDTMVAAPHRESRSVPIDATRGVDEPATKKHKGHKKHGKSKKSKKGKKSKERDLRSPSTAIADHPPTSQAKGESKKGTSKKDVSKKHKAKKRKSKKRR